MIKGQRVVKLSQTVSALAVLALLAACGEDELILEGPREGVRDILLDAPVDAEDTTGGEVTETDEGETVVEPAARAIDLPTAQTVSSWPQVSLNAQNLVPHLNFSTAPTRLWSADIGEGDGRKHRITADPVVADGRIYTLDAQSGVMAHDLNGAPLWSADLTPAGERQEDATGGGLAVVDGVLYATSGFGALVALDAGTGDTLWVQDTDAAVTGAPTVRDGIIYLVSRDNRAWAIEAAEGRILWQLPGTPSPAGLVGGAAPALTDRVAVFPFGSSELVATLRKSGIRVWASAVSGERRGRVYAAITDISGDPVVDGGTIYAATQSGRVAAVNATNGERIWTAEEGAYSPVIPIADAIFLVSDDARLVRLDRATGETVWSVDLPYFLKDKPKKFKEIYAHYGPVIAGGQVLVASNDGLLRYFDPVDGSLTATAEIPGGASTNPVIVDQTLYIVSQNGQLHAFR